MASAPVGHQAEWKVPPEQDGWTLSHDALRLDMADLARLLDSLAAQVAAGRPIEQWQADAARVAWRAHAHMLEVHHGAEEQLYFPLLRTRFEVPSKQSKDHEIISSLLKDCGAKFEALAAAPDAAAAARALKALQPVYKRFQSVCSEHYKEEEDDTQPQIRQHFAPEEVTPTARAMAKMYHTFDMGNYLRPMTPEQRQHWMSRVRMPFFIQWLMLFQCWRYNRAVVAPLEEAIQYSLL